jgi:hypothetical protein
VAFITGGHFRSNRLELRVEYINDHYVLEGEWRQGTLTGTWRSLEETEHGTWEATRPASSPKAPSAVNSVPLFAWHRGKERRYSIAPNLNEPGWQRTDRPLCRVWK